MKNIVLIGMPGCGKSTIAKELGEKLKREVIESDQLIQKEYNMTIEDMFKISESYFRDREYEITKKISDKDSKIISTGGGVILRQENIENLKKNGVIIFINRPLENIILDIDSETRPLLKDGKERLYNLHSERYGLYKKYCDVEIINNKHLDEIVDEIISL